MSAPRASPLAFVPASEAPALMTRLFDHEDWKHFDSPERGAPSFLADSFDLLCSPVVRNTAIFPDPERDVARLTDTVVDVCGPSSYDSHDGITPAQSLEPTGWPPGWSKDADETRYHVDPVADCSGYTAGYDSSGSAEGRSWDPLTDPWPSAEPPRSSRRYAGERAPQPANETYVQPSYQPSYQEGYQPAQQNLVYPEAGYAEARYVETRYVETQYVETSYVGKQYVDARAPEPHQSGWSREAAPTMPAPAQVPPTPVAPESAPGSIDPQEYDVVLPGPLGDLEIAFRDAQWYSLTGVWPRRVATRDLLRSHPQQAGAIVQVVCWWMRENSRSERALDLATELALAVSDVASSGSHVR